MGTRIFIVIAGSFAVACGSSRKTKTTTPPSNSTTTNVSNPNIAEAKPGEYKFIDVALPDLYEVKYKGLDKPVTLYINMYDPGVLLASKGFTFRQ